MKVCSCEINMADKIVEYCRREIISHIGMRDAIIGQGQKRYKDIEQAGIDTLKRVINKCSYITGKDYKAEGE